MRSPDPAARTAAPGRLSQDPSPGLREQLNKLLATIVSCHPSPRTQRLSSWWYSLKKNDFYQMAIDYRLLNSQTMKDREGPLLIAHGAGFTASCVSTPCITTLDLP